MTRKISADRFAVLRGVAVYVALAGLLLFPAAARADIELELQELIDAWDPEVGDPGTAIPPPGSPPPPPGESPGESGGPPYPTGGPGAPTRLIRIAPSAYSDGISGLAGQDRASPRLISNIVIDQGGASVPAPVKDPSDHMWQWGQFLDHDISITEPGHDPVEPAPIPVPLCDNATGVPPGGPFDPDCTGTQVIPFTRSIFDPFTGTEDNPREQINEISALIDATNVYGQEAERTHRLRDLEPNLGRMKVSAGGFLPFNEEPYLFMALPPGANPGDFYMAGDIRANETVPLAAMHSLWVREHNRVADDVLATYPWLSGDSVFDIARRIVITEMQVVTFKEFLPVLLGDKAFGKYGGYDEGVDPGMATEVSTAMYRLGHTMLSPEILRLHADGTPTSFGPLALRDAFFQCAPEQQCVLKNEGGLEPIMKGLSEQVMQKIDSTIVDDLRNFLFGPPGAGGLDLASLNIQRGRDHGLPDYNDIRLYYGLAPKNHIDEISESTEVRARLTAAYGTVDDIDAWVGALAEDPVGAKILVGELLFTALSDQFERIRTGDPNWYQEILTTSQQRAVEKQTLAKIIARNTGLVRKNLNANVFVVK